MTFLSRFLHGWAGLIRLPASLSRTPRLLLAGVTLLSALALLAWLVSVGMHWLPPRFWQLLGLCAISLAVLWWFLFGARRLSRRGFARKHIGDLAPGDAAQETAALQAMRQAIRQARQTIQRSPDMERGRDPLYRIPWVLFIGDEAAGTHALLRSASQASPFPPPGAATTTSLDEAATGAAPLWQWWFFKSMIAIETAPLFVCDPQDRRERGLWYHLLLQLAQERSRLPLNGIAVCVPAATLLGGPQAVKPAAMRLRRLVDEALEHLQVQLPIYLVVTGLEHWPGYDTFRAQLPPDALQQALGHCLPEHADTEAVSLDALYPPILDRLHALRLTALRQQHAPTPRREIFAFVEQFGALRDGLQTLMQHMLEDNPFQRTPRWRGLYFTASSTPPQGGAFVEDLFTRFLPADQPLATTRLKGHAGRLGMAGVGVAAMLGLSVLVSHSLQGVHRDDSTLLAQTRTACREPSDAGASSRIAWVARCGQTVERLEAAQDGSGLGFGLRRADRSIAQTKDTLLRDFSHFILAPYDQVIESDLARGQAGVEHIMAVSQRLRLLGQCRQRDTVCHEQELARNAAFDPHARVFSPFISGEQDGGSSRHHAVALFTTYLGYLRWQSPSVLDAEAQRLRTTLDKLLAANPPTVEQLQQWAERRRDPLQLKDFWLPAGRVVGEDDHAPAQVPAAFTVDAWRDHIEPMLDTAGEMAIRHQPRLVVLREQYLQAYMRAWGAFGARFHEGLALWRGAYDELATRAARTTDHPYQRLDEAMRQQVLALPLALPLGAYWDQAWSQARADWLGAWRPLGRFAGRAVGDVTRRLASRWLDDAPAAPAAWIPAWLSTQARLDAAPYHHAAARAYLQLTQPGDGAALYESMAALYRGMETGTAADYTLLLQAVDKPPEPYTSHFVPDDLRAWSVVQGPSRLLLFLAMQRTAQYVQARWQDNVYTPLKDLPAVALETRLYGPNGRLAAFVQDWLSPFVSDGERTPRALAGVALPLSPALLALLTADRQYAPADDHRPFPAANVQFQAPSRFGAQPEGQGGTQLEIVCQDRSYRASSQGESLADGRAQVFWAPKACPQVSLRIALPVPTMTDAMVTDAPTLAPAFATQPPRLTLLYQGPDSFLTLLQQFRSGSRTFRLNDFRASYSPAQWAQLQPLLQAAGLNQVRVFLQITPTPELERHLARGQQRNGLPDTIVTL